ncbi:sigma-70 family RNA polymerase sigma factor [Sporosarcina sp. Marseille-Q4063]|uniref:RNA polymerase sigma factor n=1 Tax=Sporosarcina sp. Marseille-Q4063 TaxID=2810514 RepID=UPI001BAFCCF8|nr:sigma-70 family RNA polymerase sigma factor [Sporosarcina sp. Marseille-Q4063]QUW23231.1 sigma-70 family RNA polymerase sigma factor [Sporosarcina sp. Marseille-Q4063]
MQENELIRNAKNGDFTNYPEWINKHSGSMIRFAFQNGLSLEEANEVTMDTYIILRNELRRLDENMPLLMTLYKILLEKLLRYNSAEPVPEDALPFKEDTLLHIKIVELDEKYRIPFILSFYHDLTNEQISIVIGESAEDIEITIQAAIELLGENRKSLEFLKKSYNRLSVKFNAEQIFGSIVQQPIIKSKKKSISWAIISAIALTIIIILLPLSFTNKKEKPIVNAIDVESFANIEEKYKTERAKRQEKLQLEDARFDQLNFIRKADKEIMDIKDSMDRGEIPRNLEKKVENIVEHLKLPSEMVADLQLEPLYESESASIEHAMIYKEKIVDLITMYNGILWDNRETIEAFEGGRQKASLLMLSKAEFPSELQHAIDTMRKQSIQICAKNNTFEINACYYKSSIHDQLSYLYHQSARAYVGMMTYDYYLNNVNMVFSPNWIVQELAEMQQAIIQISKDESFYKELETNFSSFFCEVMKGKNLIKEMEAEGRVPTFYQQAWRTFNYQDETALPISYLVQPIIEEMEVSEWRNSESWDRLTHESIIDVLKLAQEGKLEEIMFGKKPTLVNEKIDLPNKLYSTKIEKLYKEFKKNYDRTIFKELSPIYVAGVYDYANEMEDPMTMLKLFNFDTEGVYENEAEDWRATFIADWQKGFSLFEEATSIEFSNENIERFGRNYYAYVKIGKDQLEDQYIPLWIDRSGEFYLQELVHNPLPSSVEIPEMDIASIDKEWITYRYDYFTESKSFDEIDYMTPIDIIATYFHAGQQGDFETQYAFYYQGDGTTVIDKEQYLKKPNIYFPMNMENLYKTISFKGLEQDGNGNWPGIATLTVNEETNPSNESIVEINMMWTKHGWRIVYPLK